MALTNFTFSTWQTSGLQTYEKYECVRGAGIGDSRYYYATTDVPAGITYTPSGGCEYTTSSFVYEDNRATFYFTQTGTQYFQPGSIIALEGSRGYTGQLVDGGNGYITFVKEGWDEADSYAATLRSLVHPYWTTGFLFIPDFGSSMEGANNTKSVKMGDGYEQRQASFINNNGQGLNLVFKNRSDKEIRSIMNFVEDKNGVTPFKLHLPNQNIFGDSMLNVVAEKYNLGMDYYNLNSISVPVRRVFDV